MNKTKVCSKCGEEKLITEFYYRKKRGEYGSQCKKCIAEYRKKYYQANKEKMRKLSLEAYYKNREKNKEAFKRYGSKIRLEALEIVANGKPIKCVKHEEWNCCQRPYDVEILTLDHISGDGSAHLRKLRGCEGKSGHRGGRRLYYWVRNNPGEARKRLQILCMNAQWIKRRENGEASIGVVGGSQAKPIKKIKDGEVICKYESISEAARDVEISQTNLSDYVNDPNRKSAGGFQWELVDD